MSRKLVVIGIFQIGNCAVNGIGDANLSLTVIHKVTESLKGLAVGAFGIYGIEQAIHKTIETSAKLLDSANQIGIAAEKFQELRFAAQQSGIEMEDLVGFMDRLNKARIDPKKIGFFQELGIAEPNKGDVGDLVSKLSEIVRTQSTQRVSGVLQQAIKGSAAEINFLSQDLDKMAEEAHKVGAVIKTDNLVQIKALEDELEILSMVIVAQLAPALVFLMNVIIKGINRIQANKTFWEKFKGPGLKEAFLAGPPTGGKSFWESELGKRMIAAGASSQTELQELDDASDARIARLKKEQAEREKRNKIGLTEDLSGDITTKNKGGKEHLATPQSDSLLRVGNFLGSGSNPMVQIAKTHTVILRQIAHNTQRKSIGGWEGPSHLPTV